MTLTKKEIEDILEELKLATLALLEVDVKVDKINLERIKAQKRLSMARDAFHSIRIN